MSYNAHLLIKTIYCNKHNITIKDINFLNIKSACIKKKTSLYAVNVI